MNRSVGRHPCPGTLAACALLIQLSLGPAVAQEQPSQQPPAQPEKAKQIVIPEAEKNKKNPVPFTPQSVESGKNLYSSQCAMCHGGNGDGKGDLVNRLKLAVPNLRDPQVQKKRTDGEWFYILSKGHANMPPENRMDPNEKWDIINFMRSLAQGEKQGKQE
jgi:cytochrome c